MRWSSIVMPLRLWPLLVVVFELAFSQLALAAEMPQYQIEHCCDICPQALLEDTYRGELSALSKLVKGKDDWLFRTKTDLLTEMGPTPEAYAQLQLLTNALKRKGVELVLVYIPPRGAVHADMLAPALRKDFDLEAAKRNYGVVLNKFRSMGIRVPDLSPMMDENNSGEKPLFLKRDQHWTPYGAEFAAKLVADEMRKSSVFKTLARKEFVTHVVGQQSKVGSLNEGLKKICGYSYVNQYLPRVVTELKDEGEDLFGEIDAPEVVLAGTSFSRGQHNFDGFLKQYAKVDIENRAISGGGFHSAMLQYLGSQEFQDKPAKILIWEVTSYFDISVPLFYRQIMSMIDDGCGGAVAAMSQKVLLHPGKNEILVNRDVQAIRSANYLADIRFNKPDIKMLQARLWYMNGTKENLEITRTSRVETDGHFIFALRDDPEWAEQTLLSLEIEMPQDLPAGLEVEAKVCRRADKSKTQLQAVAD